MPALQMETAPSTPTFTVHQTRVIRASRARVYEAWTNPEIAKQWFGPAGMHCPHASFDLRVGGAYRMEVLPDAETLAKSGISEVTRKGGIAVGHYTKIVPNELLQFTWEPSWNPDEHSVVTIALHDVEGGTEITLTHEHLLTELSRDNHGHGWAGSLDKLQTLLAL